MTFGQAIKVINSEWDWDYCGCSMDMSGNKYERLYIKSGNARCPTLAECMAIADYLGMRYHKGIFYRRMV